MNKIVPIILFALIGSIVTVWYLATHQKPPVCPIIAPENILVVGTNAEYAPFSFMQDDTIIGFDIDIIEEVAKRLNKKIELKELPFDALLLSMQLGNLQVLAAGITPTPERAQRMLFTKPYIVGDPLVIVSPAHTPVNSIAELTHKKVAVNEGYTADFYLSSLKGPELIRLATPAEAFLALQSRRVDAIVAAAHTIQPLLKQFGESNFYQAPLEETSDSYALAISKKYPELLEPIQKALDMMVKDGTLAKLRKKWKLS